MVSSISIVTPVYNDIRVGRALRSILDQDHHAQLEMIVIDGGSTDGTNAVLEDYRNRLAVLVSERDAGIYDAMNKGVALATGEIVGILNADDRYAGPGCLSTVLKIFEDPRIQACYGDLAYIDDRDRFVRYWKSGPHRRWKWRLGWMPPHPTFFVRRQVYEQFGSYDTRLPIAADYEFMLRVLMKQRIDVAYVNRVLVHMTPGGASGKYVQNISKVNKEVVRAWRQNRLPWWQLVPLLKPARKTLQWFRNVPAGQDAGVTRQPH